MKTNSKYFIRYLHEVKIPLILILSEIKWVDMSKLLKLKIEKIWKQ